MEKINCLPNVLRELMLKQGYGSQLVILEALLFLDLAGRRLRVVDVREHLFAAGFSISGRMVRDRLACWFIEAEAIPCGRGRPPIWYTVPSKDELLAAFGCADGPSDALTRSDVSTVAAFRAGMHREFIRRSPGHYSRQFLGDRLGVCGAATRFYEVGAGWQVRHKFEFRQVVNLLDLPRKVEKGAAWLLAVTAEQAQDLFCALRDGLPGVQLPLCRYLASKFQRMGFLVFRVIQKANYYAFDGLAWSMSSGPYAWAYDRGV